MEKKKVIKKELPIKESKNTDILQIISAIYILIGTVIICTLVIVSFLTKSTMYNYDTSTLKESAVKYDISNFTVLNANSFITTFNSTDTNIIFWGRETCNISVEEVEILNKIITDYEYKINYLDIENVTDDEYKTLSNLDEFIADYLWTTPIIIITKDGKIIDSKVGYTDYDSLVKFFKNNGI